MGFILVQKALISIWYRKKSFFSLLGRLTCYKQYRDAYDTILKTLDPVLSHKAIINELLLGTEGTNFNEVQKKIYFWHNLVI